MKKAKFLVMSLVFAVLMLAAGVLFAACDEGEEEPPATHTHTWATEWSSGEDRHWHECTGEDCDAVADEALHTWDDGEVIEQATYDAPGKEVFTCTVCGYEREETIAQLQHTYAEEWSTDGENHWHECTDEGYEDLKGDFGAHEWDEGTVTTEPSYEAPGVRTFTCEVCKRTRTEDIAQLVHTYADEYSYNSTHHWYACIDEGYDQKPGEQPTGPETGAELNPPYGFLRKDEAYHVFDGGVLSEDGTYKTYTCEECGYSKTSQITKTEAGETVILQSTEGSTTSNNTELYPGIGNVWVMDGIYAFRLDGDTPVGSAWIARSGQESGREQFLDGWNIQTQDPDTMGAETAFRVYLPAIDFTKYTSVSFKIITNNALGFSLTDVNGKVGFPGETAGTVSYTYDAAKAELNVTFAVGEVTTSATITDPLVIQGASNVTFQVWGQNYTSIDIGAIKGTVPASTTEQYTVYAFDDGYESTKGRTDIVDGKEVIWHNGVYCYANTEQVYKWVVGSSSVYANGMQIQTQTGTSEWQDDYTIYLPLIDFTTYQNVTFKVRGNNEYQTESITLGDQTIALGTAEVTFTARYDPETGNVTVTLVNGTTAAQVTYTLTDADVISGKAAFTFNVRAYWYGAIDLSPIINTFTLA